MSSIQFKTRFGSLINVDLPDLKDATILDCQRTYGKRGWFSGEVPARGYKFSSENHDNFDWSIIGAQLGEITNDKGVKEPGVWHDGFFYKRRDMEDTKATQKWGMPAGVIKYSRGVKDSDLPHRVEGQGEIKYVALATFTPKVKPNALFEIPKAAETKTATPKTIETATMPDGIATDYKHEFVESEDLFSEAKVKNLLNLAEKLFKLKDSALETRVLEAASKILKCNVIDLYGLHWRDGSQIAKQFEDSLIKRGGAA